MTEGARPDLIVVGQVTLDDVVPAQPGSWSRQLGGSSLYALAGARQWLAPERLGLVTRRGSGFPFALETLLDEAGIRQYAIHVLDAPHLVEWLIYEPDGSRRSLPRNPELLGFGGEGASESKEAYLARLLAIAPSVDDIPASWLPARAVHLCPQVGRRHADAVAHLRSRVDWLSLDPSPHYSRMLDDTALAANLAGVSAYLPSLQELAGSGIGALEERVAGLHTAGFAEVVLKCGAAGALLADKDGVRPIPATPVSVVDPTGAGDAFAGAYAACRLLGHSPEQAATRAATSAARVVACRGVEAALRLPTCTSSAT